MGNVTALTRGKARKKRVNVFLDEEFAFSLDELTAATLRLGQTLDEGQVEELVRRDGVLRAQERALSLIQHRPRSRAELRQRLRRGGIDDESINEALDRLESVELVDDEAFARFWVEQRIAFRPRSKRALRFELRRLGVSNDLLDRVLAGVNDEDLATSLVQQQLGKLANAEPRQKLETLMSLLRNRGFDYHTIEDVLSGAGIRGDDVEVADNYPEEE